MLFCQSCLLNGFFHRQVGVAGGRAHEAHQFAVDQFRQIQVNLSAYMAAQTVVLGFLAKADARN